MTEPIKAKILNNEVDLDIECWSCDAGRKSPDPSYTKEDGTCSYCSGTGYLLTELGRSVMALVERHGKYLKKVKIVTNDMD